MPNLVVGADAAIATNIPHTGVDVVFGYVAGRDAFRIWRPSEWSLFPGFKVPMTVPDVDPLAEGMAMLDALAVLKVPAGKIVVMDAETRTDAAFFQTLGTRLQAGGYKVWTYGSESTVYSLPPFNGYFVAEWGGNPAILVDGITRAAQVKADIPPGYDLDFVHAWTTSEMWV